LVVFASCVCVKNKKKKIKPLFLRLAEHGAFLGPGKILECRPLELHPPSSDGYLAHQAFFRKRGLVVPYWDNLIEKQQSLPQRKTSCNFLRCTPPIINDIILEVLRFEELEGQLFMLDSYGGGSYIGLGDASHPEDNFIAIDVSSGFIELRPCFGAANSKLKPQCIGYFTEKFLGWGSEIVTIDSNRWSNCKAMHSLAMIHTVLKIAQYQSENRAKFSRIDWVKEIPNKRRDIFWFAKNVEPEYRAKETSLDISKKTQMLTWFDTLTRVDQIGMIQFLGSAQNHNSESHRGGSARQQITFHKFTTAFKNRTKYEYEWIKLNLPELHDRVFNIKPRIDPDNNDDDDGDAESSIFICSQPGFGRHFGCTLPATHPFHQRKNYIKIDFHIAWNESILSLDRKQVFEPCNQMPTTCIENHQTLMYNVSLLSNLAFIPSSQPKNQATSLTSNFDDVESPFSSNFSFSSSVSAPSTGSFSSSFSFSHDFDQTNSFDAEYAEADFSALS
jgi:hypothetical protein